MRCVCCCHCLSTYGGIVGEMEAVMTSISAVQFFVCRARHSCHHTSSHVIALLMYQRCHHRIIIISHDMYNTSTTTGNSSPSVYCTDVCDGQNRPVCHASRIRHLSPDSKLEHRPQGRTFDCFCVARERYIASASCCSFGMVFNLAEHVT